MDQELKAILSSIERSMNTANNIKKIANTTGNDAELAELM